MNSHDIIIRWPKGFTPGITERIGGIILLLGLLSYTVDTFFINLSEIIGHIGRIFILIFLFIGIILLTMGMMASLKNYRGSNNRLVANKEGLFLNITLRKNEAFYLPYQNILAIEKKKIKRSIFYPSIFIDALSIKLMPGIDYTFPKVMRGVSAYSHRELNLAKDTLDMDLDSLIEQLKMLKEKSVKV